MKKIVLLILFLFIFQVSYAAAPTLIAPTVTDPVTLSAGSTTVVTCNTTFNDADGYPNVTVANATFWDAAASTEGGADDENDHYTYTSCVIGTNTSITSAPVTCKFTVQYYSNNATWICKVNVWDGTLVGNLTNTTVNSLIE